MWVSMIFLVSALLNVSKPSKARLCCVLKESQSYFLDGFLRLWLIDFGFSSQLGSLVVFEMFMWLKGWVFFISRGFKSDCCNGFVTLCLLVLGFLKLCKI
eukprot:TRINITY_DN42005_c0_g1_i2.p1 TRINITY_DN42005_c0_g1~~TRINITY_DN42005_c0_g1_i2.p1  ORF type:complete len:100 (-),score=10.48 TRINITY_DN42005_c0_g1_i2:755-1054(-)